MTRDTQCAYEERDREAGEKKGRKREEMVRKQQGNNQVYMLKYLK